MQISKTSPSPRIIAVASGKGGVGKSHISLNLSMSLIDRGNRVLVIDADLGLANIDVILGLKPTCNLSAVLSGEKLVSDVIVTHSSGVDVLPAASGIASLTKLDTSEQLVLVQQLELIVADYDYVIIDTAAGIGSNVLFFSAASEEILVVLNPEHTSLADAYALIKVLFKEFKKDSFNVVVNRATDEAEGRAAFQRLLRLSHRFLDVKLNYLGAVFRDDALIEALREQKAVIEKFPTSKVSMSIKRLSENLEEIGNEASSKGDLSFSFRNVVGVGDLYKNIR